VSAARLQSEPVDEAGSTGPDPLKELRELNDEVEQIAARLDRAIDRLSNKD
jgi:hypothetical protein